MNIFKKNQVRNDKQNARDSKEESSSQEVPNNNLNPLVNWFSENNSTYYTLRHAGNTQGAGSPKPVRHFKFNW